jgi:Leucine-rich repeat (LRR) protein
MLPSLNINGNTALETLDCSGNKLSILNITGLSKLNHFRCNFNQLNSLDVSKNAAIELFYCNNNLLSSLDISGLSKLKYFICSSNMLPSLDVSKNVALESFDCAGNKLSDLSVNGLSKLYYLYCKNNLINESKKMDDLFKSLNSTTMDRAKNLYIVGNSGTVGCNVSIATAKGWTVDYGTGN